MILDALDIPNLSYEILEGSDRVGGRLGQTDPHLPKVQQIKYYLTSPKGDEDHNNQPSRYNDITVIGKYKEHVDEFRVSETYGGRIMRELVDTPEKYVSEVFEPFKDRLRKNWNKGFQALMKYDQYSVRGFMMSHGITPLDDYYSIQWLETLTDGSGLYDQSFSEGVIDSMDFDYYSNYIHKEEVVKWFCINGGTQRVPEAMNASIKKPLKEEDLQKRVTKIAIDRTDKSELPMRVKVEGEQETRKYTTVFATPTLACLQRIDLTELELLYEQKDALRSLHYDTASKVGMKFDHPWWIKLGIEGGLEHAKSQKPPLAMDFDELYQIINDSYLEHHAFDWHNHEYSSGAYGKFGPGQFSNLYTALTCPTADSRFHFVGEAVSAHHGWIVGALDSAHQAVINFLRRFNLKYYEDKLASIKWLQPIPDEIAKETAIKKVVLGLMDPDERLKARSAVEKEKVEPVNQEQRLEAKAAVDENVAEFKSELKG
ncbi:hypothetical protein P7C71_g4523, partial [Lecanoromycetidae sp. Uapishka_2]